MVFGGGEVKSGIALVDRLVSGLMGQEPYKSARRVFWIMDNCSAHRGQRRPNVCAKNRPIPSSFILLSTSVGSIKPKSILHRSEIAPHPNDFSSLPLSLRNIRPKATLRQLAETRRRALAGKKGRRLALGENMKISDAIAAKIRYGGLF
jgi:hypothetical protein